MLMSNMKSKSRVFAEPFLTIESFTNLHIEDQKQEE